MTRAGASNLRALWLFLDFYTSATHSVGHGAAKSHEAAARGAILGRPRSGRPDTPARSRDASDSMTRSVRGAFALLSLAILLGKGRNDQRFVNGRRNERMKPTFANPASEHVPAVLQGRVETEGHLDR